MTELNARELQLIKECLFLVSKRPDVTVLRMQELLNLHAKLTLEAQAAEEEVKEPEEPKES